MTVQKFKNVYGDDFDFNELDESIQLEAVKQELISQKVLLSESRSLGLLNSDTERQAKKYFGGTGKPKKLVSSSVMKNSTPNKLFNLGLAEDKEKIKEGLTNRIQITIENLITYRCQRLPQNHNHRGHQQHIIKLHEKFTTKIGVFDRWLRF